MVRKMIIVIVGALLLSLALAATAAAGPVRPPACDVPAAAFGLTTANGAGGNVDCGF